MEIDLDLKKIQLTQCTVWVYGVSLIPIFARKKTVDDRKWPHGGAHERAHSRARLQTAVRTGESQHLKYSGCS